MIDMHWLYVFAGLIFASFGVASVRERRTPSAGATRLSGSCWRRASGSAIGSAMSATACSCSRWSRSPVYALLGRGGRVHHRRQREALAGRYGNKLFLPALIIPFTAFLGTLLFNYTPLKDSGLIEAKSVTLVLLGLGVLVALIVCSAWLTPPPMSPIDEGGRLANAIGWALVLPQMLAALGAVFAAAGVGTIIGHAAGGIIPQGSIILAVLLYALGMVVFTMIMGNAFAAFPVMVAAIGFPILIQQDGGRAAVIGAVGMLAGYCGTLMTPMAANFNIVPAALLELRNQYGVVKVQIATAIPLLICNIVILYLAGFRL